MTEVKKEVQQSFRLNKITLRKIGIGALIALGGALLTYISGYVSNTDFGPYTALVVAIWSILVNLFREYIKGVNQDK